MAVLARSGMLDRNNKPSTSSSVTSSPTSVGQEAQVFEGGGLQTPTVDPIDMAAGLAASRTLGVLRIGQAGKTAATEEAGAAVKSTWPRKAPPAFRPKPGEVTPSKVRIAEGPGAKTFGEQKYAHELGVRVTWPDGQVHYDTIKGLNKGHALARAEANWPGAKVESMSGIPKAVFEKLADESLASHLKQLQGIGK